MAIQDDFTVNATGDIRYVGAAHGAAGAGYYTVIQFHRWLQDLADDAVASSVSSDFLDITDKTPSERQTDNIIQLINSFNIDQTASEHLYDGSIIQGSNGSDIWDGLVVIANLGMDLQIIQNGAIVANDFWNNIPNGETTKGLNRDANSGYSHRFMLKVRTASSDIDGRRIIGQTRVWGKTFSEFKIGTGTSRGNNVLALTYADDNNNQTTSSSVATWTDITNTSEGYNAIDVDANSVNEYYYSKWNVNKPTRSINNFYERMKYLTRQDSAEVIYGLNGELFRGITHQIVYSSLTGVFDDSYPVSFSNGATAQVIADNGTTTMWVQILTGTAPVSTNTITQSTPNAATATASTVTERVLTFPFCGQSTGSALIGGYGVGVETDDLTSNDKITALDAVQRNPPNNQTFYVNGVVVSEDYIIVGPKDTGDDIKYNQYTTTAALSTTNITAVTVGGSISSDTPTSGTIRVADNNGIYRRLVYTARSGSVFTIDPTASETYVANVADFNVVNASIGNNVFISYIDKLSTATSESFSATYSSDRSLWVRVRDGKATPIKTFESAATFGSGGGSATVIRTSDA